MFPPNSVHIIASPAAMHSLGQTISTHLDAGDVLLLHGDLGAGKTVLTQGIAHGLGISGPIQSPTFTLVHQHQGPTLRLYHLDLYRLTDPHELDALDYAAWIAPDDGVTVIEWPERAGDWLPPRFLLVTIDHLLADQRRVTLTAHDVASG